ncbi:MAG: hypothetical protein GF398_16580 [Chitinivibrionales bacterium]|nr:hypothetical protein [Chitinivibrionales bacterium]
MNLLLPCFALYAETHFRFFPGQPSLLFRREPEVIFDAPRRIAPGRDLPVYLVLNDIYRFPVELTSVEITLHCLESTQKSHIIIDNPATYLLGHALHWQSASYLFLIQRDKFIGTDMFINAKAEYRTKRGHFRTVFNDNLPGSSKNSLLCHIAKEDFPGSTHCIYGDMHLHSHYSQSHVEFGPPIRVIDLVAKAYGLDFVAVTDHSYDLACDLRNYLRQDATQSRWISFQEEFSGTCNKFQSIVLPGEEISCLNSRGKVVHMLGIGLTEYVPGTRDGARPNTAFKKQLTIGEAIEAVQAQNGLAFAAHPGSKCSIMQQIFLHRGMWEVADSHQNLDGFQAVNSGFACGWQRAKGLWTNELRNGHPLPLVAGNDSHGDFNRFRLIGVPFVKIEEHSKFFFGSYRTGIYGNATNQQEVTDLIRQGRTFATGGPFITIAGSENVHDTLISNKASILPDNAVFVIAESTYEFGSIDEIRIIAGSCAAHSERVHRKLTYTPQTWFISERIELRKSDPKSYLRAEIRCKRADNSTTQAFTSPCWYHLNT